MKFEVEKTNSKGLQVDKSEFIEAGRQQKELEEQKLIINKINEEKNNLKKELNLFKVQKTNPFEFKIKNSNFMPTEINQITSSDIELTENNEKWIISNILITSRDNLSKKITIKYVVKSKKYDDIVEDIKDQEFLFIAPNKLLNYKQQFIHDGKVNSPAQFEINKINSPLLKYLKLDTDKSTIFYNNPKNEIFVKLVLAAEKQEFITYLKFSIIENKFTMITKSEFDNLLP
ncbi:hypothetical protein [[Mycoplasma] phocidae]|uniref:hypothetical protein n=1 Tax=[Mycoplasma] phocae TaxID=142651 RepID=UPI0024115529|nr:hypothetical protein [[Mycoplasma] phocae]